MLQNISLAFIDIVAVVQDDTELYIRGSKQLFGVPSIEMHYVVHDEPVTNDNECYRFVQLHPRSKTRDQIVGGLHVDFALER
jgi:hypothetical protein